MLDLSLHDLQLLLDHLLGFFLLLEVAIDQVFLWHLVELSDIHVESLQVILLALECHTEVIVLASLTKLDLENSTLHDATFLN